nr:hypothetical protein Itr_chr10CG13990 [Ipomoea trifida]GMD48426.1 hypothetical protein Iba_chr10fCG6280 [Ipomoea batatas]
MYSRSFMLGFENKIPSRRQTVGRGATGAGRSRGGAEQSGRWSRSPVEERCWSRSPLATSLVESQPQVRTSQ